MKIVFGIVLGIFVWASGCEEERQATEPEVLVEAPKKKLYPCGKEPPRIEINESFAPYRGGCGSTGTWSIVDVEEFKVEEPRKPVTLEDALSQAQAIQDARTKRLEGTRKEKIVWLCNRGGCD